VADGGRATTAGTAGGGASGSAHSGGAGGAAGNGVAGSNGLAGGGGVSGNSGVSGMATSGDAGASGAVVGAAGADGSAGGPGECTVTDDKRVFVSSALYDGALGGLAGADKKCQALATAAGLCGTFKAWLSDGTTAAADRLTHASGNYVRMDGQIVASGWSGLTSGTLLHAINRTERNAAAPVGTLSCANDAVPVWTDTLSAGTIAASGSCSNWQTASPGSASGVFGNANATNLAWTQMCQLTLCNLTAALYCVEQ
jgi:hypothetical protein